jgi:hypothetical protein
MKRKESLKEYHSQHCLSKTKLFRIIDKCPEWFKYCEDHPEAAEESKSLLFGAALHKYALEPESFFDEYAVMPNVDRRTKAGKEEYIAFSESIGTRDVISNDDFTVIQQMNSKIKSFPLAKYLLTGEIETSYYYKDSLTGIDLQARPDVYKRVGERGLIVDLKTCASADSDTFRKSAVNYGYDMQAAMFIDACTAEYGIPCDFVFVAVEKTPPYMVNVLSADELLIKYGRDRLREAIGIYKECSESGNWYGYNGFSGIINNLGLPSYLAKEIQ